MRHHEGMNRAFALLCCVVGLVSEGVAIAVLPSGTARWNEAAVATVTVAYAAVGLLIVWHRPGHPIGTLAVLYVLVGGVGEALVAASYVQLQDDPSDRAAALASAVGAALRGLPWLVVVLWLPLRFPDGRSAGTRLARVGEWCARATISAFLLSTLFAPRLTDLRVSEVDNPIGVPHALATPAGGLAGLSLLGGVVCIGLGIAVLVQRYRRTGALGRQQTLIFAVAFVFPLVALVLSFNDSADPWVFGVASIPLPVAIGIAVLQRRLYDLPLALNRSLTYGTLWVLIALFYAVLVGGIGAMVGDRGAAWLPWLAAGVVAVSFAPLRDGLQRGANRVTYGQWARPDEVRSRTVRRLADVADLPALLDSLAAELADGLGLGWVEITDAGGRVLAVRGERSGHSDELPLTAYGEVVGVLRWTHRVLRDVDRELLSDLAVQLGAIVHADGLLASVRAAQERLVVAQEEERRRLRRDLHDGLGPALAGLTLQVDTLRNRVAGGAASGTTDQALLELRGGIQDAVLDVRRIVEGLRPAALDDLGLEESLHQLADRAALPVSVESAPLPALPAAVEVAAFRIVQEALTNVSRHAAARSARVRLRVCEQNLEVCVEDDGVGVVVPRPGGVGLGSMRERAEGIGGTFELAAVPGEGTRLSARLPLDAQVMS